MYQRATVHQVAVANVPASEYVPGVTENAEYSTNTCRKSATRVLVDETATTIENIKKQKQNKNVQNENIEAMMNQLVGTKMGQSEWTACAPEKPRISSALARGKADGIQRANTSMESDPQPEQRVIRYKRAVEGGVGGINK